MKQLFCLLNRQPTQNLWALNMQLESRHLRVRTEVREWANNEHLTHWRTIPACRQAKMLISGPDRQLTRSALGLNRLNR